MAKDTPETKKKTADPLTLVWILTLATTFAFLALRWIIAPSISAFAYRAQNGSWESFSLDFTGTDIVFGLITPLLLFFSGLIIVCALRLRSVAEHMTLYLEKLIDLRGPSLHQNAARLTKAIRDDIESIDRVSASFAKRFGVLEKSMHDHLEALKRLQDFRPLTRALQAMGKEREAVRKETDALDARAEKFAQAVHETTQVGLIALEKNRESLDGLEKHFETRLSKLEENFSQTEQKFIKLASTITNDIAQLRRGNDDAVKATERAFENIEHTSRKLAEEREKIFQDLTVVVKEQEHYAQLLSTMSKHVDESALLSEKLLTAAVPAAETPVPASPEPEKEPVLPDAKSTAGLSVQDKIQRVHVMQEKNDVDASHLRAVKKLIEDFNRPQRQEVGKNQSDEQHRVLYAAQLVSRICVMNIPQIDYKLLDRKFSQGDGSVYVLTLLQQQRLGPGSALPEIMNDNAEVRDLVHEFLVGMDTLLAGLNLDENEKAIDIFLKSILGKFYIAVGKLCNYFEEEG